MPYTKTTWTDEVPSSTPVKYKISQSSSGDIAPSAEIEIVTSLSATGTPVNAANLNKIETGIETAQSAAEDAQATATMAIPKSLVTTIGDLIYATASATLARLAKPAATSVLQMTSAGAPSWKALTDFVLSIIYRRQGGSATVWNTQGTTTYTPTSPKIQVGVISLTFASVNVQTVIVTFPVAYTNTPIVFLDLPYNILINATDSVVEVYALSASQLTIRVFHPSGNLNGSLDVSWLAIGE